MAQNKEANSCCPVATWSWQKWLRLVELNFEFLKSYGPRRRMMPRTNVNIVEINLRFEISLYVFDDAVEHNKTRTIKQGYKLCESLADEH